MKPQLFLKVTAVSAAAAIIAGCEQEGPSGPAGNVVPVIAGISVEPDTISVGESAAILCQARDDNGDNLTFEWSAESGNISGNGASVTFASDPCCGGETVITCTVRDGRGGEAVRYTRVIVR